MNLPEKEFSQLSNEEAKEQLLSILPEDEKTELETYDIFYFDRRGEGNWEISEGNPKVWMLRQTCGAGYCKGTAGTRSYIYRVGKSKGWL